MCCLVAVELQALEEVERPAERPVADLVEREVAEPDGRRVVAEPAAHARGARDVVDHPLELVADRRTRPAPPPRSPGRGPCTGTRTRAGRSPAGTANQASPAPWRMARRCRPSSSSNGVSRSIPCASAIASIIRAKAGFSAKSGQTATAPVAERLVRPSGISTAGLAPCCVPSPSQTGHQPSGLLNEKWCGESSSKLRPQPSQTRCWL